MKLKIYQINSERDKNNVKFLRYEHLDNFQNTKDINAAIYDEVFVGDVDCENLEDVYTLFNTKGHPLCRGHSLSISDIAVTDDGAYYCDSFGFIKVDFDESITSKQNNLLKIVYVEPKKAAYVSEIENSLESMQRAVGGGLFQTVQIFDDNTIVVCNEESKLMGMPGNRRYGDGTSIIAGPFFVCGIESESFRSLTEEETEKYLKRFAEPEDISDTEVEADMKCELYPL